MEIQNTNTNKKNLLQYNPTTEDQVQKRRFLWVTTATKNTRI